MFRRWVVSRAGGTIGFVKLHFGIDIGRKRIVVGVVRMSGGIVVEDGGPFSILVGVVVVNMTSSGDGGTVAAVRGQILVNFCRN